MSEVYGSARLRELLAELEETIVQAGGGRDLSHEVRAGDN
jgi:hypothetical protein